MARPALPHNHEEATYGYISVHHKQALHRLSLQGLHRNYLLDRQEAQASATTARRRTDLLPSGGLPATLSPTAHTEPILLRELPLPGYDATPPRAENRRCIAWIHSTSDRSTTPL